MERKRWVAMVSIPGLQSRGFWAGIALVLALILILSLLFGPLAMASKNLVLAVAGTVKQLPIYSVGTQEKKIAFSFDATWGAERTPKILDTLDRYRIKTTFFLTNIWLKDYAPQAQEIARRGHEIGMHSATHPHFTSLSPEQMQKELQDNYNRIREVTGQKPKLFRPPFGDYNNQVVEVVKGMGFTPIQWSVDSLDWRDLSGTEISQRVLRQAAPGAIVLFHNDGKYTPEALPVIIEQLQADGYQIVPISQMLLPGDYYVDVHGVQRSAR